MVSCRNPIGRTGMTGRGLLGRWGPNHAADPIVTRWKKDCKGNILMVDGKPRLEFVAIKRKDTGHWAIPGVSKMLVMGREKYCEPTIKGRLVTTLAYVYSNYMHTSCN